MALFMEIALVVFAIYLLNKYFHNYWTRKGFKQESPSFFVGNIGEMLTGSVSIPDIFDRIYYKHRNERFVGLYNLYRPTLFIVDTKLVHEIMIKDFNNFHDHSIAIDEENDPLSGSLFGLKGQKWRDLRIKLTPTFTSGKLRMMLPTVKKCVDILTGFIDAKIEVNQNVFSSKELFMRFNTNVISSVAFGVENDCINETEHPFYRYGRKFFAKNFKNNLRQLLFMFLPNLAILFKVHFAPSDVERFFRKLVKEIVDYREKANIKRNDFMDLLLQLKNVGFVPADKDLEEGEERFDYENHEAKLVKLSLDEITAHAFVFFLGSLETLSSSINFLFLELARNERILKKVQEEIDRVFAEQGFNYDAVRNLKYLECCMRESLRKYPAVPIITRECTKDYKIPDTNLVIEKGVEVTFPVFSIQRDPEIFENPLEFKPERFMNSATGEAQGEGLCYFPFGDGPRHCIGMRMALVNMKVAVSQVLAKFNVELITEKHRTQEIEIDKILFPLTPADDIMIRLTKREK